MQFAIGGAVLPFIAFHLLDEGFSFSQIGTIFFVGSTSSLVFPMLWGFLSDRYIPLNRLFVFLNLMTGLSLILLHRSESLNAHLFVFAAYYAFYHPTLILVNSLCFHHLSNPTKEFGFVRAMGSLGWIVPSIPLFLVYFYQPDTSTGICLHLASGIAFLNAFICLGLPKTDTEKNKKASENEKYSKGLYFIELKKLIRNKNFICLLFSLFFASSSFSLLAFYSTPYLEEVGIDRAYAGPIQSIGVVIEVILMPFLPLFFRKFGFVNGLIFGLMCLILRHATSYFWPNPIFFSGAYLLVGLMVVYYYTIASMALDRLAHNVVRSTSQTFMVILGSGLGPMSANLLASYVMNGSESLSLKPVFGYGIILSLLSLVCLTPAIASLKRFLDKSPSKAS